MKKNSWKTLLSVLLLLAMLVSMLPFAAFAEGDQTAAAQTEAPAKFPRSRKRPGTLPRLTVRPTRPRQMRSPETPSRTNPRMRLKVNPETRPRTRP